MQLEQTQDAKEILTLVDDSILATLPRITPAMWSNRSGKRSKLYTHFQLLKSVPVRMNLTDGGDSLSGTIQPRPHGHH